MLGRYGHTHRLVRKEISDKIHEKIFFDSAIHKMLPLTIKPNYYEYIQMIQPHQIFSPSRVLIKSFNF